MFWFMIYHTKFWLLENHCVLCDKVNGFFRVYDKTRYLALFNLEKYNVIYDRIRYLIGLKSSITYVFSYNFGKIKID